MQFAPGKQIDRRIIPCVDWLCHREEAAVCWGGG